MSPTGDFLPIAAESHQRMPLETLGFKTSSFADKSCHLNPAKAGNWRISINAAAALGDGRDLLFYRGDVPPAGNFLPIAAESFHRRVSRFPATLWRENRDTSSKPPRFIRHRRRFGGFRQKPMVFGFPLRLISNTALLPAFPATGKSGLSETQIVIATTGRRLPVGEKKKAVCRI